MTPRRTTLFVDFVENKGWSLKAVCHRLNCYRIYMHFHEHPHIFLHLMNNVTTCVMLLQVQVAVGL